MVQVITLREIVQMLIGVQFVASLDIMLKLALMLDDVAFVMAGIMMPAIVR